MSEITVIKCNHLGVEVYRWRGKLIERDDSHVILEARFGLGGLSMGEVPLNVGDRFVETYFSDRWYNWYEVHDHNSGQIKCWYCNIAYPADLGIEVVSFRDLALDLLVYPDGRQEVLDAHEFEALNISAQERANAQAALNELKIQFTQLLLK